MNGEATITLDDGMTVGLAQETNYPWGRQSEDDDYAGAGIRAERLSADSRLSSWATDPKEES